MKTEKTIPTTTARRDLAPLIALAASMSRRDPTGFLALLRVAAMRPVAGPFKPGDHVRLAHECDCYPARRVVLQLRGQVVLADADDRRAVAPTATVRSAGPPATRQCHPVRLDARGRARRDGVVLMHAMAAPFAKRPAPHKAGGR